MAKFFKAVWSGNIVHDILVDFNSDVRDKLNITHATTSQWQTQYGDFNGDGKKDILLSYWGNNYDGETVNKPSDGQLVLLLGNGAKGFKDGTSLLPDRGRLDSMTMQSAVADFNGDGIDDIILTNHSEDGRNNAYESTVEQYAFISKDGKLEKVDLNFNTWGRASTANDFNGDGRIDFAVFGWVPNADGDHTAIYLQNADGTFAQNFVDGWFGGNMFLSGDFDGDGELEFADFNGYSKFLNGFTNRLWEINDDGSVNLESVIQHIEEPFRNGVARGYGGNDADVAINLDAQGNEFYDESIHFGEVGDVNGDGADDVVAINYAFDFKTVDGKIVPTKNLDFISIYSAVGGNGMEKLDFEIRGWTPPDGLWNDLHLVDWNGDGHLDIFIPWEDRNKKGLMEAERVFLNDGTGNFSRLNQKFLPSGDNKSGAEWGDFTDANGDGIMDVIVRPKGFWDGYTKWDRFSETLYLGTKRIASSDSIHNAARDGAAGFNEDYYLNQIESSGRSMRSAGFESALEHYLSVGKASGAFGFAAGSHIYGYSGSETIILREGNESVDAFGGDDIITGAAGADILNGGKGADIFVYLAVSDSGVTAGTRDLIEDFVSGTDRIDLSGIDAISGTTANEAFVFLTSEGAGFTGKSGELRWFFTASGADQSIMIEGDVNGDAVADLQIEVAGTNMIDAIDLAL